MDLIDWRSAITVLSMVVFVVLVIRVWSRKQKAAHDAAAQLPFIDSKPGAPAPGQDETTNSGGRRG
jgi:hypothetical protein